MLHPACLRLLSTFIIGLMYSTSPVNASCATCLHGGLKEQMQQSVSGSERANHETENNPVFKASLSIGA